MAASRKEGEGEKQERRKGRKRGRGGREEQGRVCKLLQC